MRNCDSGIYGFRAHSDERTATLSIKTIPHGTFHGPNVLNWRIFDDIFDERAEKGTVGYHGLSCWLDLLETMIPVVKSQISIEGIGGQSVHLTCFVCLLGSPMTQM
jgi:hypothetical protein